MGRPKGSKNKTKVVETDSPETTVSEVVVTPTAQPSPKITGHSLTVVEESWKPSPDMGDIKSPESSDSICTCLHKKALHYGPSTDWCNVGGCQCQTFVKR